MLPVVRRPANDENILGVAQKRVHGRVRPTMRYHLRQMRRAQARRSPWKARPFLSLVRHGSPVARESPPGGLGEDAAEGDHASVALGMDASDCVGRNLGA